MSLKRCLMGGCWSLPTTVLYFRTEETAGCSVLCDEHAAFMRARGYDCTEPFRPEDWQWDDARGRWVGKEEPGA